LFVQPNPDKQARVEAMLGELAELGLMLARELARQAQACEDPADAERLAAAFNKTSRAVRLTLALDAKLERDGARMAREDAEFADRRAEAARALAEQQARALRHAPLDPPPPSPAQRHKTRVRNLLNRLIWNESEGDAEEYDILRDDLDARLHEAAQCEGFAETPVEVIARRVAADMGLSGELVLTRPAAWKAAEAAPPRPAPSDTG
jgi:hypothetical protein